MLLDSSETQEFSGLRQDQKLTNLYNFVAIAIFCQCVFSGLCPEKWHAYKTAEVSVWR